jgi:YHS domain-containing protein
MKTVAVILLLAMTLALPVAPVFAANMVVPAEQGGAAKMVDVGNTKCPIMGGPVSGKDFIEYQGKRYGICCAGCAEEFEKNPEKYLAKLKEVEPK